MMQIFYSGWIQSETNRATSKSLFAGICRGKKDEAFYQTADDNIRPQSQVDHGSLLHDSRPDNQRNNGAKFYERYDWILFARRHYNVEYSTAIRKERKWRQTQTFFSA